MQMATPIRPAWSGGLAGRFAAGTSGAGFFQHTEHSADESDPTAQGSGSMELQKHGQTGGDLQKLGAAVVVSQ